MDYIGKGPAIAEGAKTLGTRQTAFYSKVAAIEAALCRYRQSQYGHMVIYDSQSAIARANHSGAGPGQGRAKSIQEIIVHILLQDERTVNVEWVKGHARIPGNERADALAARQPRKLLGPQPPPWPI
jgi:ribonuclease HI